MRRIASLLAMFVLLAATAAFAAPAGQPQGPGPHGRGGGMGGPGGPPPFERDLYPPQLVLHNQIAIGLTADQTTAIKKALNETHSRVVDIQVDLQRATEKLTGIVDSAQVDEAAALAAADEAMALEMQMKKAHLTLLIRVKNLLTPDQQAKLDQMRPRKPAAAEAK